MRRLMKWLIVLIASVWVGVQAVKYPGFLLISAGPWSMEMPLWFAILSTIVLVVVLFFLLRLISVILGSWRAGKNWWYERAKKRAYNKTNRGLLTLIEGHWKTAEYFLQKGIAKSDAPLINYLGAAKAAHERGAFIERDRLLRRALEIAPNAEIPIGIVQAQLLMQQGKITEAIATLIHLKSLEPRHGLVLKLLERCYIHLADWSSLIQLLPDLRRGKAVTAEQLAMLERHAYEEYFKHPNMRTQKLMELQSLWHTVPRKVQSDPRVVLAYAKLAAHFSEAIEKLRDLIFPVLKKHYDDDLVMFYGALPLHNTRQQLSDLEIIAKLHGKHAPLSLRLGTLCVRCQLWGKARNYFEESLRLQPTAQAAFEYGKLLEQLGETDAALKRYREGLVLS